MDLGIRLENSICVVCAESAQPPLYAATKSYYSTEPGNAVLEDPAKIPFDLRLKREVTTADELFVELQAGWLT